MNDMTQNTEKIKAVLRCVVRPDEKQTNGFVSFLKREDQTDPKIWGGFILEVGSEEYDWSLRGRENQIGQRIDHACEKAGTAVSQDKIISILRAAAEDFKVTAEKREVGFVETAGDGIVTVHGLRHAMYGEIILFENGVKGMVQNITDDGIGAILFDEEGSIGEGSKVVGTGKQAGIPVSDEYLGRVINALGEPIDGGTEIHAGEYRPIEEPAPGIVERKSVSEPLQTGILSIHSGGYHSEPEGKELYLHLCCDWSEGFDHCRSCQYAAAAWRHGVQHRGKLHRFGSCTASVYSTLFGNLSCGILHA